MPEKAYVTEDRCSEHVKSLSAMMAGSMDHVSDTLKLLERGQDKLAQNQDRLWLALTDLDKRITHDNGTTSLQTQVRMNTTETRLNAKAIATLSALVVRFGWLIVGGMATMLTVVLVKLAEK